MDIKVFEALVFQVNFVDGHYFLDNRGKIFDKILNFSGNKLIENSDTLRVSDENADYSLNTAAFVMRLNIGKLNEFISYNKKTEIISHVNEMNKKFITKTKEICNTLKIEKISRFACRFISNYENLEHKDIQDIFNVSKNLLGQDLRELKKEISINKLIMRTSYINSLLKIDMDKYINTNQFNVDEISDKYDEILKDFRDNIFIPKTLIKESY